MKSDIVKHSGIFTPVLVAGCAIILVSFSIRASFGVFQIPIAEEFNWARTEFSLAIAIQNLCWGIGQPIFGALAEKIGDRRAVLIGSLMYALGLLLSSMAVSPITHQFLEVLVGFGIAGTGFGVILAVVARASSDKHRAMSLAIVTAAGSGGQIIGPLLAEWLLIITSWQTVFTIFAAMILSCLFVLPFMKAPLEDKTKNPSEDLSITVLSALRDPSFSLLFLGFFSCGYQLAFITAHFPALVTQMCSPIIMDSALHNLGVTTTSGLGAVALSLIGISNLLGTLTAGYLGNIFPKKYILASIYAGRTVVAATFILLPITPETVLVFSILMGALWLATVPLTSGLIGQIYGLRYMGTLFGIVFFSHQLGSFIGVWLGGRMYDTYGDYEAVWWIGVAIGAFSAIIHLPIKDTRLPIAT